MRKRERKTRAKRKKACSRIFHVSDAQHAEAPSAAQALELGDWGGKDPRRCNLFGRLGPGYTRPGPESGVMRGRAGPSCCRSQARRWDLGPGTG